MPTPAQILPIAEVCQFLALNDEAKQMAMKGGFLRQGLYRMIYIVRSSVQWLFDYNSSDSSLVVKANYLYWLCTPYIGQAQFILNSGGSGEIINPATGVASTIEAILYETTVDGIGTPTIVSGATSVIITDDFILEQSIQVIVDTVPIQYGVYTDRLSYTVVYTDTEATITFYNGDPNQGLQAGWKIEFRGLKFVTL